MSEPFKVMQEELDLQISPTQDGYMPVTISTLNGSESMTVMLRPGGVSYLCIESLNYLIDMKEIEALRILRDTLFALDLSEGEKTCQ